jgi:hypothetical protein
VFAQLNQVDVKVLQEQISFHVGNWMAEIRHCNGLCVLCGTD